MITRGFYFCYNTCMPPEKETTNNSSNQTQNTNQGGGNSIPLQNIPNIPQIIKPVAPNVNQEIKPVVEAPMTTPAYAPKIIPSVETSLKSDSSELSLQDMVDNNLEKNGPEKDPLQKQVASKPVNEETVFNLIKPKSAEDVPVKTNTPQSLNKPLSENGLTGDPTEGFQIQKLRTYKADVQEAVKSQNISTARILLQEQQRRAKLALSEESTTLKSSKNKIFFVLALILITLAGGIFGYSFYLSNQPQQPTSKIIIERPDFINVEQQLGISVTLRNKRDVLRDIESLIVAPIEEKSINELLILHSKDNFENGKKTVDQVPITTAEFFSLTESRAPNSLVRSLDNKFMIGVYGIGVGEPFTLFKVKDFENTFASLLSWEPLIARDLQPIFFTDISPEKLSRNPLIGTPVVIEQATTSSSTPRVTETFDIRFDPTTFSDVVIQNRDARVIRNEFGEIIFFYTFIDEEHLIFTAKEEVLTEVMRRLRGARLIR